MDSDNTDLKIIISKSPQKFSEDFLDKLIEKRTNIICNIVKRIFLEGNV